MWNTPTRQQLDRIPRLYETENTPLEEKLIYLQFFIGGCEWYVSEYDGDDLFFGFAILNSDYEMADLMTGAVLSETAERSIGDSVSLIASFCGPVP